MIICDCGHGMEDHDNTLYLGCMHCGCDHSKETIEARYWARRMMKERDEINSWNDHHFYLWGESQDECETPRTNYKDALNLASESLAVLHKAIDFIKWAQKGSIGTIHKIDTDILYIELGKIANDFSEFKRIEKIRNKAR